MKKIVKCTDRFEDNLLGLLYKWRLPIFLVCVTGLAFWARTRFWPFVSADYTVFLHDWLDEIRRLEGLHSIGVQIGNYTAPYHYLLAAFTYIPGLDNLQIIKISSTLADFAMAAGLALIVWQLTFSKLKAVLGYCIALCLPTVFLNSAAWGQCDAMYTAFALFSIYFWLRGNKGISMAFFGVSMSIKLQAVFLLPAFVIFWLCGRLRIRHALAAVGAYIVVFVPAIIAGGSLSPLFAAYRMQTVVHTLAPNIANVMALFNHFSQEDVYMISGGLVAFAMVIIGAIAYFCWAKRKSFTPATEFLLLFLMVCLVPYIMPGMHERYFYIAEVLAVAYALCWPRRVFTPLCLQLGTIPSYVVFLVGGGRGFGAELIIAMGIPALVAFWDLYRHLTVPASKAAPKAA